MTKTTREVRNEKHLKDILVSLSKRHGGAWVFSVKSFTHTVRFERFQSPCRVPDWYKDLTQNMMAYKGQLRGFTQGALTREQNRGLGRG